MDEVLCGKRVQGNLVMLQEIIGMIAETLAEMIEVHAVIGAELEGLGQRLVYLALPVCGVELVSIVDPKRDLALFNEPLPVFVNLDALKTHSRILVILVLYSAN